MSVLSPIEVPAGKHVLRVMNNSGHDELVIDPTVEEQVAEGVARLEAELAKGGRAFMLDPSHPDGGEVVRNLDPKPDTSTTVSPMYVGG